MPRPSEATSAELGELPFDDVRKRISAVFGRDGDRSVAMKGAPESVLAVCSWPARPMMIACRSTTQLGATACIAEAEAMAEADGLRVLAVADARAPRRGRR